MNSFSRLLKKYRLIISFLLIIVLFLSFGIFTIQGLFTLGNLTKTIYEHPLVVSNASLNAALNISKIHRNMKTAVSASSDSERQMALDAVDENEQQVYRQLDIIQKDILGAEGVELERQTRQLVVEWRPIREEVIRLVASGKKHEAVLITKTKGINHVTQLEAKMQALTLYARNTATGFMRFAETSQTKFEYITIVLTLAGVLLSIVIALVTSYLVLKAEKGLLDERDKLKKALEEIKTLRGIIPICAHCKQIRDDEGMWNKIEKYIHEHSEASFSHGICPDCMQTYYPEEYAAIERKKNEET